MRFLTPVAVVAAACAPPVTLADLSRASLMVEVSRRSEVRVRTMVLSDLDTMDQKPGCRPPAPGATATLNGVALTRARGFHKAPEFGYDRDCLIEFAWRGSRAGFEGPAATLRISDRTAAWTLEIPEAFAARTITVVEPRDGRVRPGDRVTVRWSPPTDRLKASALDLVILGDAGGGDRLYIRAASLVLAGSEVTFSIPADVPRTLFGRVSIDTTDPQPFVPEHRCPVASCRISIHPAPAPAEATIMLEPEGS